jgi:L-aminopeptidase/D-esterase-like protein
VAGVDVRGAAPATRETDLLDPVNTVQMVHAIVLSGGSAFGLDAASGVMRYLEERGVGFAFGPSRVPIVPAAAIFDLTVGDGRIRPDASCGYEAAKAATTARPAEGSVGVGAGATVGKLRGMEHAMKGGLGSAEIHVGELVVAALVAVNAVGDVIDPATGRVVAGARGDDGKTLVDARALVRGGVGADVPARANTTIGVIATNARLTKTDANRNRPGGARRAGALDRAGAHPRRRRPRCSCSPPARWPRPRCWWWGELASQAVAEAVLRAVREASRVEGVPAVRDLAR